MTDAQPAVLIASADAELRAALAGASEPWGHAITQAANALEAWAAIDSRELPGVILLDAELPGGAAWDLCQEMRTLDRIPRSVFVVVLASQPELDSLRELAEHSEVDQVVPRSLDPEVLAFHLGPAVRVLTFHRRAIEAEAQLLDQAARDALTGLWNRAAILDVLDRELARVAREGGPLGVMMLDLDLFKEINDQHGHLVGDAVLREVGRRLSRAGRLYDLVGRYGGDEFLVVVPGCDLPKTRGIATRLRTRVASRPVKLPIGDVEIDISVGATAWTSGPVTARELVQLADQALYTVKKSGRGGVATLPHL